MSIQRPAMVWPITIADGQNNKLRFSDMAGMTTQVVTIPDGTYETIPEILAAIQAGLDAVDPDFADVSILGVGENPYWPKVGGFIKFVMGSAGSALQFIDQNAAAPNNTALSWLGYVPGGGLRLVGLYSVYPMENVWFSPVAVSEDSADILDKSMDTVTRAVGGPTKFIQQTELVERLVTFRFLSPEHTYIAGEGTTPYVNTALENLWRYGRAQFRYYQVAGTWDSGYGDYVLSQPSIEKWQPDRQTKRKALYTVAMKFWGYVSP